MNLYKYRADTEYTAEIFRTRKVWLSTAAGLNDPFECEMQAVDAAFRLAQVRKMKEAQLSGFLLSALHSTKSGTAFFGLQKKETRRLLQEFKNLKDFDRAYAKFRNFMQKKCGNPPSDPDSMFASTSEQLSAVGIFSLSQVPDQPLMWAHYADDHKGICLGFEITDGSALGDVERCLRVEYGNGVPEFSEQPIAALTLSLDNSGAVSTASRLAFSDPSLRAAVSTKGPEWKYEQEWRYIEPIGGAYDWPAPITEITFGLRCPQERRAFYIGLARECIPNEVRFYEMRKVPNTKSLERVRLEVDPATIPQHAAGTSMDEVQRLMHTRQFSAALLAIDSLQGEGQVSAELWRCKGIALGWDGRHEAALECFNRATDLDDEMFSAWYQKGVALTQLERFDDAIAAYLRAQQLCADEPSIAFNLGSIFAYLQRYGEAIAQIESAVKLGHPRASDLLARVKAQMPGP
ncbi:MAG TPA: DUF2971 domain-containing protein [Noviherbaspirillum sp.]|uniref:tetratricopeptide repeat protein n=1 Tax=Noviherbaspirillum sp. TaxID=1926288 RepID=UPI002F9320EF